MLHSVGCNGKGNGETKTFLATPRKEMPDGKGPRLMVKAKIFEVPGNDEDVSVPPHVHPEPLLELSMTNC